MGRRLSKSAKFLRGTHLSAGLIPHEIGKELSGRSFRNFGQFRREFWQTVAQSRYAPEFASLHYKNRDRMKEGLAPYAHESQHLGRNQRFTLHHIIEIQNGGGVYDIGNLVVASPRYHNHVFHRVSL